MVSIRVYFCFFRSFIFYLFGINSPEKIAFKSFLGKSFRIPEKDKNSIRFIAVVFFQVIGKIWSAKIIARPRTNFLTAIYDVSPTSVELRKGYLACYHPEEKIDDFLFKETLLSSYFSRLDKLSDFFSFFFVSLLLFPFCLFRRTKGYFAMIPQELIETNQLVRHVERKKINRLFFFCIYEKDANFASLVLLHFRKEHYKITSEVPLAVWNRNIVADKICCCFHYQLEEIEFFKKSICYSEILLWGPERAHLVLPLYAQTKMVQEILSKSTNKIGFYSTGGWLREKLGHLDQGLNFVDNEKTVLDALIGYCKSEKKCLSVFLHPREKSELYREETFKRYEHLLKGVDYEYANLNAATSELFHHVNLAVAFASTVVFERLYFGFKTIIMPVGFTDFPLQGTAIESICAGSGNELAVKIRESMPLTTADFFRTNQLGSYSTYSWK